MIVDLIPEPYRSRRRLRYLAGRMDELSVKNENVLRERVGYFGKQRLERDASDMGPGGRSCDGHVWYRMDGDKRREEDICTYEPLETDTLILNLLNEKQTRELLKERAADFSYRLDVESQDGRPCRFRATTYWDYDHVALNMRAITDEIFPSTLWASTRKP
jgi:twitching motility protein PilT